jgi:hypothetical protein
VPLPPAAAPWLSPDAVETASRILESHLHAYGQPLIAAGRAGSTDPTLLAQELFAASTLVLAHDDDDAGIDPGPRLIYANRSSLRLWRRAWGEMIGLPSRLTAEPAEQAGRSRLLATAREREAIRGYTGVRIDSHGRRFVISGARLWTLRDARGTACGQAAAFSRWWWL